MDNEKNDDYYLQKIIQDIDFILKHTEDVTKEILGKDEILLDSMLFRMIQISENAKKLTDEFKSKHDNIFWKGIYGLRNHIVHDYGNADLDIVYETIKSDIPDLKDKLNLMMRFFFNGS